MMGGDAMQEQAIHSSVSREASESEEQRREKRTNPYIRYIFSKPKYVEKVGKSVPIRTVTMGGKSLLFTEETLEIKEETSKAYRVLLEKYYGEPVRKASLPRWTDWYSTDNSVYIRDVLDIIIDEFSQYFGEKLDYTKFTTERYLNVEDSIML
jgi:hypothetical protein